MSAGKHSYRAWRSLSNPCFKPETKYITRVLSLVFLPCEAPFWQQWKPLETRACSIKIVPSFQFLHLLHCLSWAVSLSDSKSIRLLWKTHIVLLHQTFAGKQQPGKSWGNAEQILLLILNHPDAPHSLMLMVLSLPWLLQMVLTGMGTDTGTAGLASHINQCAHCSCENCYLAVHKTLLSPANATARVLSCNLVFLVPRTSQRIIYLLCQYCIWPIDL